MLKIFFKTLTLFCILFLSIPFVYAMNVEKTLKLFNFNSDESGHPFDIGKDVNKNGIAKFAPKKYYNFDSSFLGKTNFSKFDNIELDVFNPNITAVKFHLSLGDNLSNDYWSELNHIQSLAPGWNHLILSLTQTVGERGSVKINRKLDLTKIKKFYIIVDPDSKTEILNSNFSLDNIYLTTESKVEKKEGIWAFDFTNIKKTIPPFQAVVSDDIFQESIGYGFKNLILYRAENDKYASESLSTTIGIVKGDFSVNLPNGMYKFQIIIDSLGYWDVPFFSNRMIYVNEKPVFKETRNNGVEYLKDLLKFENVSIDVDSKPYQLYYPKIFQKIEKEFVVTNGKVKFSFEGDDSGVNLNTLIIWKKEKETSARIFLDDLEKSYENSFNKNSRRIVFNNNVKEDSVSIVSGDGELNLQKVYQPIANELEFKLARNESDFKLVQVHASGTDSLVKINISNSLSKIVKVYQIIPQFISSDINHETYSVGARIFKDYSGNKVLVKKNTSYFFAISVKPNLHKDLIDIKDDVEIQFNDKLLKIPIKVQVLDFLLPSVNFPIGFMGIDPLPYTYFKNSGYKVLRSKYRMLALDRIAEAGFTTLSGLPEVEVGFNSVSFTFDSTDLDQTLKAIQQKNTFKTIFTYGGQFPNKILDLHYLPNTISEGEYYRQMSPIVNKYINKNANLKIVHTFSDEASGYNQKVSSDIALANKFKKYFPQMNLGGFTQSGKNDLAILNSMFDYGLYSSLSKNDVSDLVKNKKLFGLYNAAQNATDDPRFVFGLGMYLARKAGISYYLEWNSIGFNNYPYFDFDGRESDVVLFYPNSNGDLYNSLRFELAHSGLNNLRKLQLIETLIESGPASKEAKEKAKKWLMGISDKGIFYNNPKNLSKPTKIDHEFKLELNNIIYSLYK